MTYVTVIDDAYRERAREWLASYAADGMRRGVTLSLPPWLAMREMGVRRYVQDVPAGDLLYAPAAPGAGKAYVTLLDGSEVAVPA